ncbi:MAG: hypothetical protein M3R02_13940 [Chloroflexota bacterium]|nr:hypothetical protein [Chloroflexota bacterium]
MEMLIAIALLAAVALLASRFGHDSRDELDSKERNLASYGVTWADIPTVTPTRESGPASRHEESGLLLSVPLDPEPAAA